jgi:hypothetical protein
MDPDEAMCEDPAFKKRPKFPLYKTWNMVITLTLSGQEGFKVSSDHLVERALLWIARKVSRSVGHAGSAEGN